MCQRVTVVVLERFGSCVECDDVMVEELIVTCQSNGHGITELCAIWCSKEWLRCWKVKVMMCVPA
jgi:hypothetical protein